MKIQGSVAVVTGGAQGIGEQICRALLERGGKVSKHGRLILSTKFQLLRLSDRDKV